MTDFATMIDFATSDFKAAQPAAEFVAKKFSATLQAYPSLAEYYEWTVSSATDAYANRPSVDAMFDLTRTTITQKAPWMVSQVESHMAKNMKQYESQKADKIVLLVILAISVLAILILTKKALASLLRCVLGACWKSRSVVPKEAAIQRSPKSTRKSVSPKRALQKLVETEEIEETEEADTAGAVAIKSVTRRTSTKTPRMRTPSSKEAKVAAEPATVESATPAPAKVLDFGVTPKKGVTAAAVEEATPRRSARIAAISENAVPMPAVDETEPVTMPAENPASFEWEKLTVPDLKAELRRRGEKVGAAQRKADLVERLQALDARTAA
jgi:hypothetical protein